MKHVVIVGCGFAGLNAAKVLGKIHTINVSVIDRRNHYLFQPLLYQVATAALSPAEIASPIRQLLSGYSNTQVLMGHVNNIDLVNQKVLTDFGDIPYHYLMLACGSQHSYFGKNEWEAYAPGLKSLEQAVEMRRRIFLAFEEAERTKDPTLRQKYLTFVVVGGGPTGIELAGAISEISQYTLSQDFRSINPKSTRIILVEAGKTVLSAYPEELVMRATRDLQALGIEIVAEQRVTDINESGVKVNGKLIESATVLWAAGVRASHLNERLGVECDATGRIIVQDNLTLKDFPNVYIAGDQASCLDERTQKPLPALASVAAQQGTYIGKAIKRALKGEASPPFSYRDHGMMTTIGKNKAIADIYGYKFVGTFAWILWLFVHIYYLIGFKNKMVVFFQWAWSYATTKRGARLILNKHWRHYQSQAISNKNKK